MAHIHVSIDADTPEELHTGLLKLLQGTARGPLDIITGGITERVAECPQEAAHSDLQGSAPGQANPYIPQEYAQQLAQQAPIQMTVPAPRQVVEAYAAAMPPATAPMTPEQVQAAQQAAQSVLAGSPVQPSMPTVAPTYTLEQLRAAGGQLMDAGRMADLQALFPTKFGCQALTEVPKERYGEVAAELRKMGAKI